MSVLLKSLKVCFEILNEFYTAVGAGFLGMAVLLHHGFQSHQIIKNMSVVALTATSLVFVFRRDKEKIVPAMKKVVIITGCDSGLGFSLAQHIADLGFTVIATFLNLQSKGSQEIKRLYKGKIIQVQLDITDPHSVKNIVQTMDHYFAKNSSSQFYALINNAAVMVFGEFEWQTENLIHNQISVNLEGTLRVTNAFLPLMRQHKGRIITISSHCALANLPGVSVYGATKAALSSWSDGLRIEMDKFGVKVLSFIPGSFTTESNIMARQLQYIQEMHDNFSKEQHHLYSHYFKAYNIYLSQIKAPAEPRKLSDKKLYEVFNGALLDKNPNTVYKHEPMRYKYYHFFFKYSPVVLRDYMVTQFMKMPQFVFPMVNDDDLDNFVCACD